MKKSSTPAHTTPSFRDRLASVLGEGDGMARFEPNWAAADAVLAMPEMHEIADALSYYYADPEYSVSHVAENLSPAIKNWFVL
jgi:hypothetical protein